MSVQEGKVWLHLCEALITQWIERQDRKNVVSEITQKNFKKPKLLFNFQVLNDINSIFMSLLRKQTCSHRCRPQDVFSAQLELT